jgi:hypothetical protein
MYATTTQQPSLQAGSDRAVQFSGGGALASSFFLIKHTFKNKGDAGDWWKSQAAVQGQVFETWVAKVADAGFYNTAFLPTAEDGPFYCLWEAEAGKTKADMQSFIDESRLSPTTNMVNDVMSIDAKLAWLSGRFFGEDSTARSVSLPPHKSTSTFYVIEHTFKSAKEDAGRFWEQEYEIGKDPAKLVAAIADTGFYNTFFLPTAWAGPFYCLWEAEAGKTKADMEKFINTNKLVGPVTTMENHVMPIPSRLIGGAPVPPFFKA